MTPERQRKLDFATLLYSLSFLTSEAIEEVKNTDLYKQRKKQLCNELQRICDSEIETLQKRAEDSEEAIQQYYMLIESLELFLECIRGKGLLHLRALLKDFHEGQVRIVDEGKHGKFIRQLETA